MEIKRESQFFLGNNTNGNSTRDSLRDISKAVFRGQAMVLNAFINEERMKINLLRSFN